MLFLKFTTASDHIIASARLASLEQNHGFRWLAEIKSFLPIRIMCISGSYPTTLISWSKMVHFQHVLFWRLARCTISRSLSLRRGCRPSVGKRFFRSFTTISPLSTMYSSVVRGNEFTKDYRVYIRKYKALCSTDLSLQLQYINGMYGYLRSDFRLF